MYLRYEIVWLDSGSFRSNGWECKQDILDSRLSIVKSCGYLIHEDDDTYYIALTMDEQNEHFYGVQLISKKNVQRIVRLRER